MYQIIDSPTAGQMNFHPYSRTSLELYAVEAPPPKVSNPNVNVPTNRKLSRHYLQDEFYPTAEPLEQALEWRCFYHYAKLLAARKFQQIDA